jgi:hypothetical protein
MKMELLKNLGEKPSFECFGKTPNDEILKLENSLRITFVVSYKIFLQEFGCAEWFGHTIFGISDDEDCKTLSYTIELREGESSSEIKRIPHEGNVLGIYGGGGHYFLHSNESSRAGEVSLFIDELYGEELQSWTSFEEFLDYMISL